MEEFEQVAGETAIDPDEMSALLPDISTRAELNALEQANIATGARIAYSNRRIRSAPWEMDNLLRLHALMFGTVWRWAGQIRRSNKNIGVDSSQIRPYMRQLEDDVRFWIESSTYEPQELTARFHHRLVWIHPFTNGNGRHGRLATELLARVLDIRPPCWGPPNEESIDRLRRHYLDALRAADGGDIAELIDFMFEDTR